MALLWIKPCLTDLVSVLLRTAVAVAEPVEGEDLPTLADLA